MTAELMITKEKGKNWAFQFCCDHDSESVLRRALHTHMRNRWEYRVCVWVGQELLARAIIRAIIRSVIYTHIYASIYNRLLMKWVSPPYSLQTSRPRGSCPEAVPKGPYSNSRYSTGTNFQLKPMRVGRSFSNATGIHLFLMIFPRMSLHCKLDPGQYREYKYGSFYEYLFARLRTSLHAVVEPNPNISLDQTSNQIVFRCTGYCHKSGILLYAGFSCPVPSHSLAYIEVAITFHTCPTRKIWKKSLTSAESQ